LKIDHLTIAVRSLAESGPYYAALLPLIGMRQQSPLIWSDGDGFYIQFIEAKPGTRDYERYGPGLNHVGFGAASPDDVLRVRDGMARAGFAPPQVQDLGGAQALFMKDPDGLRFEITYYPPGAKVVG
jgi:lactoylglutathione lyase